VRLIVQKTTNTLLQRQQYSANASS